MFSRITSIVTLIAFLTISIIPPQLAQAQNVAGLPAVGTMIMATPTHAPFEVKGLMIDKDHPLSFDFLMDVGDTGLGMGLELQNESEKLIKYFLSALTIPEEQMWVNLSPYEKDRIVAESLGQTDMGKDLLAQDYLLKQLTSSLMYPKDELGKKFWEKVYEKIYEKVSAVSDQASGFSDSRFLIPDILSSFNKVWIVPNDAQVYEKDGTAYIVHRSLKVMLESDYLAEEQSNKLSSSNALIEDPVSSAVGNGLKPFRTKNNDIGSWAKTPQDDNSVKDIIRSVLIPEIEREVNNGQTFARLRQIYDAMILATWYKVRAKESLLGQIYVDQNKIEGVNENDPATNERIWQQYVQSFQKGVFDLVQEDYDPQTQSIVLHKYFSGGMSLTSNPNKGMLSDIIKKSLLTTAVTALAFLPPTFSDNVLGVSKPQIYRVKIDMLEANSTTRALAQAANKKFANQSKRKSGILASVASVYQNYFALSGEVNVSDVVDMNAFSQAIDIVTLGSAINLAGFHIADYANASWVQVQGLSSSESTPASSMRLVKTKSPMGTNQGFQPRNIRFNNKKVAAVRSREARTQNKFIVNNAMMSSNIFRAAVVSFLLSLFMLSSPARLSAQVKQTLQVVDIAGKTISVSFKNSRAVGDQETDTAIFKKVLQELNSVRHVVLGPEPGVFTLLQKRLSQYQAGLAAYAVDKIFEKDNTSFQSALSASSQKVKDIILNLKVKKTSTSHYLDISYHLDGTDISVLSSKKNWVSFAGSRDFNNAEFKSDDRVKIYFRPTSDQNMYLVIETPDGKIEVAFKKSDFGLGVVVSIKEVNKAMLSGEEWRDVIKHLHVLQDTGLERVKLKYPTEHERFIQIVNEASFLKDDWINSFSSLYSVEFNRGEKHSEDLDQIFANMTLEDQLAYIDSVDRGFESFSNLLVMARAIHMTLENDWVGVDVDISKMDPDLASELGQGVDESISFLLKTFYVFLFQLQQEDMKSYESKTLTLKNYFEQWVEDQYPELLATDQTLLNEYKAEYQTFMDVLSRWTIDEVARIRINQDPSLEEALKNIISLEYRKIEGMSDQDRIWEIKNALSPEEFMEFMRGLKGRCILKKEVGFFIARLDSKSPRRQRTDYVFQRAIADIFKNVFQEVQADSIQVLKIQYDQIESQAEQQFSLKTEEDIRKGLEEFEDDLKWSMEYLIMTRILNYENPYVGDGDFSQEYIDGYDAAESEVSKKDYFEKIKMILKANLLEDLVNEYLSSLKFSEKNEPGNIDNAMLGKRDFLKIVALTVAGLLLNQEGFSASISFENDDTRMQDRFWVELEKRQETAGQFIKSYLKTKYSRTINLSTEEWKDFYFQLDISDWYLASERMKRLPVESLKTDLFIGWLIRDLDNMYELIHTITQDLYRKDLVGLSLKSAFSGASEYITAGWNSRYGKMLGNYSKDVDRDPAMSPLRGRFQKLADSKVRFSKLDYYNNFFQKPSYTRENIPIYVSQGHNWAYLMWKRAQADGRIPMWNENPASKPQKALIFHIDAHNDIGWDRENFSSSLVNILEKGQFDFKTIASVAQNMGIAYFMVPAVVEGTIDEIVFVVPRIKGRESHQEGRVPYNISEEFFFPFLSGASQISDLPISDPESKLEGISYKSTEETWNKMKAPGYPYGRMIKFSVVTTDEIAKNPWKYLPKGWKVILDVDADFLGTHRSNGKVEYHLTDDEFEKNIGYLKTIYQTLKEHIGVISIPRSPDFTWDQYTRNPVARILQAVDLDPKQSPDWGRRELARVNKAMMTSKAALYVLFASGRFLFTQACRTPGQVAKPVEYRMVVDSLLRKIIPTDLLKLFRGDLRMEESPLVPKDNVGGINLDAKFLDLNIKRDDKGIPLPVDLQDLEKLKDVKGFVPIIINIQPIMNLPQLLGLDKDSTSDDDNDSRGLSLRELSQAIREV